MVGLLSSDAIDYFLRYRAEYGEARSRADLVRLCIADILESQGLQINVISQRAKEPFSALAKIRSKGYANPSRDMTDELGVRVITYYQDDVDRVADVLRTSPQLVVLRSKSPDRRQSLGLREFGYRSVHLVARLRKSSPDTSRYGEVQGRLFEVQVRSLLEHAWAEIEHQIVYKSGIKFPAEVRRRFSAVAGTLEVLDREFLQLRQVSRDLVIGYRRRYEEGDDGSISLDVARLIGLLAALIPDGKQGIRPENASACLSALRRCGVATGDELRAALKSRRARRLISDYAGAIGAAPVELSHFAVVVCAVIALNAALVRRDYADLLSDGALATLASRRAK